ncbi:MAG TPA: J domain-containing protein, partial [Myxococcota bacterium]|nr:J domain-containing protein [Myxococcota bacterium]
EPIFADFSLELPAGLRRLGSTGQGRMVMALLASARAGGRPLQQEDVRYIRSRCTESWKLDDDGVSWLRSWLKALREVEEDRLSPEKVAERVGLSTELPDQELLLGWLVEGGENHWKSAAARRWVESFAAALGLEVPWSGAFVAPRSVARAAQILGIPEDSPLEEARLAWRRLVQENHPDRAADPELATRRTAQINAAWTLLREIAEKSEA